MTSKKRYISYSTRSMDTKLDRMVAYDKEPQTTKLNVFGDSLHDGFTWHHVTNKKKITSPFPRAMATKLDKVMAFEKGSPPITLQNSQVTNKKHLYFYKTRDYQAGQGDDLYYWTTMHKLTWFFDHVIICCLIMTIKKTYLQGQNK